MNPLDHFEIGYDRSYVGAGLHCRLCPPDRDDSDFPHIASIEWGEWANLADWATIAKQHLRTAHPYLPTAVADARARAAGGQHSPSCPPDRHAHSSRCAANCPGCEAIAGKGPAITVTDAYHARMQALRAERDALSDTDGDPDR